MDTSNLSYVEMAHLQRRASQAFDDLPAAERERFYDKGRLQDAATWETFGRDAQATIAPLEYIASLPEPSRPQ
jgi:hypothetical protein